MAENLIIHRLYRYVAENFSLPTPVNMKVAKISKKLIKPLTPTPPNLKNYNLSFLDMFTGPINFAVVLFYESKPENNSQLEESLAKILVQFYPLAGRYIKNDRLIDCSDEGVEFVEAEAADVELMDLLDKIDADQLNDLLPDHVFRFDEEAGADPLMAIQATHFPSGGVAIAISVCHNVFDASSLGTFIAAWSNATNPDSNKTVDFITPSFDLPLLLPYKDLTSDDSFDEFIITEVDELVAKRFLFDKVALTSLKSKIRPNINGKTISGVRVVCAVIAKALIAVDCAKHGEARDFIIAQPINMRERTIPPQPKHACGNFAIPTPTRRVASSEVKDYGIQELVDLIGDSVRKSIADNAEIVSPNHDRRGIIMNNLENLAKQVWNPKTNAISFTDWSKFGFYEADFGWGKPIWTCVGPQRPSSNYTELLLGPQRPSSNSTVLMSNKEGDGIEAWVYLNQNDMRCFEQDEDIKLYAI